MAPHRSHPYRLGEALVLAAALHVEGLDLGRETAEQYGFVDGVCHHPLGSLRDVLRSHKPLFREYNRYNRVEKARLSEKDAAKKYTGRPDL